MANPIRAAKVGGNDGPPTSPGGLRRDAYPYTVQGHVDFMNDLAREYGRKKEWRVGKIKINGQVKDSCERIIKNEKGEWV